MQVDASGVAAVKLSVCYELNLLEINALRAALPRGKRTPMLLLKAVHDRMHGDGCDKDDCKVRHPELEAVRTGFLRQFDNLMTRSLPSKNICEADAVLSFDFRAGTVTAR